MGGIDKFVAFTTKFLNVIGGAALTFMVLLTTADVIMRAAGRPIIGTYEVVGMCLGFVVGFCIPKVSYDRGHVYMEIVLDRLPPERRNILNTFTRMLGIGLFLLIGYNLFSVANELRASGEVSPTIQLPYYPIAYGVGVCCFLECLVLVHAIVRIWRGEYE